MDLCADEYVQAFKIRDVLEAQLVALLREKPADVFQFIADWAKAQGASERGQVPSSGHSAARGAAPLEEQPQQLHPPQRRRRSPPLRPLASLSPSSRMQLPIPAATMVGAEPTRAGELRPLSPYMPSRGPAPLLDKSSQLTLPHHAMRPAALRLEGSMGQGDFEMLPEEEDAEGSPRLGTDFANLGVSVVTPRTRNHRSVAAGAATSASRSGNSATAPTCTGLNEGTAAAVRRAMVTDQFGEKLLGSEHAQIATFVQCNAAAPLPLRMPEHDLPIINLDEKYHSLQRVTSSRCNAVRFDGVRVSLKFFPVNDLTGVELDELLREIYSIINVSSHENVVGITDGFYHFDKREAKQLLCVAQEFLESPVSLAAFVKEFGLLSEASAGELLRQLVEAVHYLHFRGQPHQRINAENVYVGHSAGAKLRAKLGMFDVTQPSALEHRDEAFASDIRSCGEMVQRCVEPEALRHDFGEIVDSMCCSCEPPSTAAILAKLASVQPEQILANTGIPLVATDDCGVITGWNEAATLLFKFTSEEAIGRNVTILMRGLVQQDHDRYMTEYRASGKKWKVDSSCTVTCYTKSGEQLTVEMRVSEAPPPQSNGFVAVFRDVSPQLSIAMHNALHVRCANIAEYIPIACVTVDQLTKHIVAFNRAASLLLGYSPGMVIGTHLGELAPPDSNYKKVLCNLDPTTPRIVLCRDRSGAIITARMFSFAAVQTEIVASDSPPSSSTATAAAPRGFRPQPPPLQRALEVMHNYLIPENSITNDFNSLFTTIADSLQHGIVIINEYGMITKMSHYAERLFEHKESEIVGRNVRVLMEDSIAERHQEFIERFKKCGVSDVLGRPMALLGLAKSGAKVKVRICVQPYYRHSLLWFVAFISPIEGSFADGVAATDPVRRPSSSTNSMGLDRRGSSFASQGAAALGAEVGDYSLANVDLGFSVGQVEKDNEDTAVFHPEPEMRQLVQSQPSRHADSNTFGRKSATAVGAATATVDHISCCSSNSSNSSSSDNSSGGSSSNGPGALHATRDTQPGGSPSLHHVDPAAPSLRLSPMRRSSNLGSFLPSSPSLSKLDEAEK